ncbi:hypothetical protein AWM73_06420 [Aerococcus urinae]|nr:hypothetical protein AWM73_06420 [Aerococcus urinae]
MTPTNKPPLSSTQPMQKVKLIRPKTQSLKVLSKTARRVNKVFKAHKANAVKRVRQVQPEPKVTKAKKAKTVKMVLTVRPMFQWLKRATMG